MRLLVLAITALALAGCNRGGAENKDAVRQGVLAYLSSRPNLSMASMNVDVSSVTFKGNEADAVVSFSPKGAGGAAQGMSIRYTLERQGNRWVVKGKGGAGNSPHPGATMPQGGMQPPVAMPPGHPATKGTEQK